MTNLPGLITGTIVLIGLFVEVVPIKISPLGWLGRKINGPLQKDMEEKIKEMEKKQEESEQRFMILLNDVQESRAESMRQYILDFQNSTMQGRKHTMEEWRYAHKMCDKYEAYIESNNLKNSEADLAIEYLRETYSNGLKDGNFILVSNLS